MTTQSFCQLNTKILGENLQMSKKQLIMKKALELFAKQGFEATSVQQITDYCGISKGAFYLSFKSKDELIHGLIDHFMQQLTVDVDYTVRHSNSNDILYYFFHTTFQAFLKHANFVKLLMKEQTYSLNDELLTKMHYYDQKTDETILSMIVKAYGEKINNIKYDLIFTIKGLINGYAGFILFNKIEFNVDLVARSLVEKTNLLAKNITTPFITKDYIHMFHKLEKEEISKGDLLIQIAAVLEELEDSIEKESLLLLKEQITNLTYNAAIIKGLIENIRKHPQCVWISYTLMKYFYIQ